MQTSRRAILWAECLIVFVLWPAAAIVMDGISKFLFFALPLVYALAIHLRANPLRPAPIWAWRVSAIRFLAAIPILMLLTRWLAPEAWLAFPRERTGLWAAVLALYPLVSALPQEFLYRRFFFWRYALILGEGGGRIAVNAALFGWLHAMYDNWPAVILSTLGGVLFAHTYARTRSLALVWIEHAVYGQALFTLGLGRFFYESPV